MDGHHESTLKGTEDVVLTASERHAKLIRFRDDFYRGSRTSCLDSEDVPMKPVSAIARKTLRMILEASRDMYPREFGAILRAEEGTITELILVPGTVSGKRHAIFQLHTLPADFSVVGTV